MISSNLEKILVPYCKFQNGHPPKWGYEVLKGRNGCTTRTDLIYGYCSPFYGEFAVFGQYHYHSRNKNLTFGLIDKNLNPVENAIYSSLEVYPFNNSCFIGSLNSKVERSNGLDNLFLNPTNQIWLKGYEVHPINSNLFALSNLHESSVKIYSCMGECIHVFPFFIDDKGRKTMSDKNSYIFDNIKFFGEHGFRLKYWDNGFKYFGDFDGEPIEEYWEKHFYIDFDSDGNYLFSGHRTDFDDIKKFNSVPKRSQTNYPAGVVELSFVDVQQQLFNDKIIDSDKIYNPIFFGAKVFMYESRKLWEPQSRQFRVVATL
ncbi:MAG: hypothetical protein FJX80_07085 [Bacteroidetes bacterium]|nr:hypothetical protein [Bacteroidota bacterium]